MKNVDCVIVTYNRLTLLKKCIEAVTTQTYKVNKVFVVDNNSSDKTPTFLRNISSQNKHIVPIFLSQNVGGAGGFNEGIKHFILESHSSYAWVMDDDTIPSRTALENMMKKTGYTSNLGFLCSNVRWIDGHVAQMNIPETVNNWNESISDGLVELKSTSFVSVLFPRNVVLKCGLPIKDYFIWGDDVEYTRRITQNKFKGFLVTNSKVIHAIKSNIGSNIIEEKDINRIKRYYLARRNTIFTMRNRYSKKELVKWVMRSLVLNPVKIVCFAKGNKILRIKCEIGGTVSGFFFKPKIQKFVQK